MRRLVFRLAALVLFGVSSLGAPALGAQGFGRIQGVVRDGATQRPIASAFVTIGGTSLRGRAGADGTYSIDSVPVGVISLRAQYIGFKPHELAGLRILAGQPMTIDFTLESASVTLRAVVVTPGLLLRFQLIRPIATATIDKSIMPIDAALRDLFQWPGYRLLSQAAIATDMPTPPEWGGTSASAYTQTVLNVDGDAYELGVRVDTVTPPRVKMTVSLVGLGRTGSVAGRKVLLSTTVTVGFGRTVVLGSTQPGSGRGGMGGTLILAVRPEIRPGLGPDDVARKSPEP